MNRPITIFLLLCAFAALPAQARESCRAFELGAGVGASPVTLVNPGSQQVTVSLSFRPASDGSRPHACGMVSLAAGESTDASVLASRCIGSASPRDGVLRACVLPGVVRAPQGLPTGELAADLMANNLAAAGR